MTKAYENLIQAIVLQAVKDWRKSVKKLKKHPRYTPAKQMKDECEDFFLSDWFEELTDVDGSNILRRLRQEESIHDK